jgi:hypothetical protein
MEANMIPLSYNDLQILISISVFVIGCICTVLGAIVLVNRGFSREVRAIAAHTAKLGRKGVASEVTGLVNSASELVGSINQLVKTATGIGVFLILLGLTMIGAAYWVVQQIQWPVS